MKATISVATILIAIGMLALVNAAPKEQYKEIAKTCMTDNGVSDQEHADLMAHKIESKDIKDNMKCAMHCFMAKIGTMDEAGKFDAEKAKAATNDPKITAAVDKCKGEVGANPCETAFAITSCMFEQKADMGM